MNETNNFNGMNMQNNGVNNNSIPNNQNTSNFNQNPNGFNNNINQNPNGFNNDLNLNQNQNNYNGGNNFYQNPSNYNANNNGNNKTVMYILIGAVALVVIAVLVFCVFGSKTLTCTSKKDVAKEEYVMKFRFNKLKSADATITFDLSDYTDIDGFDEYKEKFITDTKELFEDEFDGIKPTVKENGDKVTFDFTLDKKYFEENGSTNNYDELKKEMEEDDYTCK